MKVTKTAAVEAQINKYKRFFERAVLFNHTVKMNDQFYYKVQYWKWGKNEADGCLILRPTGELVPREEAYPVLWLFGFHNVCVHKWMREVVIEKEKPVSMYAEKLEYILALRPYFEDQMNHRNRQDLEDMIDMCSYMADSRKRIAAIHEKGLQAHNQMLARGYVIQEDHTILSKLLNEVNFINYEGLRKQAAIWDSVERLAQFFDNHDARLTSELEKKRQKLSALLAKFKREKLRKIASDSIHTYESYTPDKHAVYHSADELNQAFDRQDRYIFETSIKAKLRNP